MRKFLLPIINLVNLILVSIAWGLSGKSAVIDAGRGDLACGNIYQVIWEGVKPNGVGIAGFFLFIFGCAALLVAFVPFKYRKFVSCGAALMLITAGILFVNAPWHYDRGMTSNIECTSALLAIASLIIIAGAFAGVMALIEFLDKKQSK